MAWLLSFLFRYDISRIYLLIDDIHAQNAEGVKFFNCTRNTKLVEHAFCHPKYCSRQCHHQFYFSFRNMVIGKLNNISIKNVDNIFVMLGYDGIVILKFLPSKCNFSKI